MLPKLPSVSSGENHGEETSSTEKVPISVSLEGMQDNGILFYLCSYFVSALQSALHHHKVFPLTNYFERNHVGQYARTHTNTHRRTHTPDRSFKAMIVLTLSCCVLRRLFSLNLPTCLFIQSLCLCVWVCVSSRQGHWLQKSRTSWNTDIRAKQNSAVRAKHVTPIAKIRLKG